MSKKTYRPYQPNQLLLLPPALQDWLPHDHFAYFLSDVVDSLDLSQIEGDVPAAVEFRGGLFLRF